MKIAEREKARELREKGMSVAEIGRRVSASRASVIRWIRDIEMSPALRAQLERKHQKGRLRASDVMKRRYQDLRDGYQKEGEQLVEQMGPRYAYGCLLYWAEGSKSLSALQFSNTDLEMMKFFANFLRESFGVSDKDITIWVMAHTNNDLSKEEIESYWMKHLGIPETNIRAFRDKAKYYKGTNFKKKRHPYGVCNIRVCKSSRILNNIYGSIRKILGLPKEWDPTA